MSKPILWIVIPCYNEEQVLPITAPMFLEKISGLAAQGRVSEKSRVLFVNDGSKDKTWELIQSFAAQDEHYIGISQSRNRGHQNAVLAGLMEALHSGTCDVTISIDCDGQAFHTSGSVTSVSYVASISSICPAPPFGSKWIVYLFASALAVIVTFPAGIVNTNFLASTVCSPPDPPL